MKFSATSTFGASLFFVLANLTGYSASVQAAVLPRDGLLPPTNVPIDLIPKYFELMEKCNDSGTAPITVLYEGGEEITYEFDECILRKVRGHLYQLSVLCKAANFLLYPTDDCTGDASPPIPVPFLAGTPFPNPVDVDQVLGASGRTSPL